MALNATGKVGRAAAVKANLTVAGRVQTAARRKQPVSDEEQVAMLDSEFDYYW